MGQSQSNETFVSNGTGGISSPNAFETLVSNLSIQLGPSNGLDVDIDELTTLMEEYSSSESEWSKYALKDLRRGYTRNLVDVGNGKSNLVSFLWFYRLYMLSDKSIKLILVWSPGKGSPIHDHANAHCLMRILKGSLKETRYSLPGSLNSPLIITKETWYTEGQVTYMSDELGLHKITNADPDNVTVSLHCKFSH